MSKFTDYTENLILDHLLGTSTWTKPNGGSGIYIALFETTPGDDGTGGTEATYTSYARVLVSQLDAEWTQSTITDGRSITNANAINMVTPTANGNTLNGYGVYNALTGGNLIAYNDLTTPVSAVSGTPISFASSSMVWNFTGTSGRLCDTLNDDILDHIFRTNTWSKPSTLTWNLVTTLPNQAGGGGVNFSGSGYSAPTVGPGSSYWDAASGGVITSNAEFSFGTPTADWTGLVGQTLSDGATVVLRLTFSDSPRTYSSGDAVYVPAGAATVTVQ